MRNAFIAGLLAEFEQDGENKCWSMNKNHCQKKLTAVGPTAKVCVGLLEQFSLRILG